MKIITARQMRELDEKMTHEYGITALSLMEKAGAGVAELVLNLLRQNEWPRQVILFAGKGNNGGDAFVAARILEEHEVKTQTLVLGSFDEIKGTARESFKKLQSRSPLILEVKTRDDLERVNSDLPKEAILVDALLGTGSKGSLQGIFAETTEFINLKKFLSVIAIDLPSGLDPDRGCVRGIRVRADHTVTLGLPKQGLFLGEALEWVGVLHVVDLGIPEPLLNDLDPRESLLLPDDLTFPPKRKRLSHKGDFGHLLILGGSPGLTGAPTLASLAALRSGAGLVTVGIPKSLNSIMEIKLTEPMTVPLPESESGTLGLSALDPILNFLKRAKAMVIGPGLSTQEETGVLIHRLLPQVSVPMVMDADALNILAQNPSSLLKAKAPVILTPHPGEMARLTGKTILEIQEDRWNIARQWAQETKSIVVLKGAGTVIASSEGNLDLNVTGNAAMAVGGMGDLLAGMIGGFLAQGMSSLEAAKLGVYLHGACGDEAVQQINCTQGLLASDLLPLIPRKLKEISAMAYEA
ncbi:MAG: NAD(P)H-hydrate dehydratase [Chlamydiae bacterium]|nr:NAD(P)H-hydrate dehydratase [Chlamydiota bacterium]